jgi:hypothetical protein
MEKNIDIAGTDRANMKDPTTREAIDGIEREKATSRRTERTTETVENGIEAGPETEKGRGIHTGNTSHVLVPQESIELKNLGITTDLPGGRGLLLQPRTRKALIDHIASHAPRGIEMLGRVPRQPGEKKQMERPIPIL